MGRILRISNLSDDTTAKDLRTLFEGVGTIAGAKISRQKETGTSKGYGYVKMEDSVWTFCTSLSATSLSCRQAAYPTVVYLASKPHPTQWTRS